MMMLPNLSAIKYKQLFQRTSCALAAMLMVAMVSPASASVIWNFSGTTNPASGITGFVQIDDTDGLFTAGNFLSLGGIGNPGFDGNIEAFSFTDGTNVWTNASTGAGSIEIELGATTAPGDIVDFFIDVTQGNFILALGLSGGTINGTIVDQTGDEATVSVLTGAFSVETLPEPSTTALLALGLLGAGFARKRRVH